MTAQRTSGNWCFGATIWQREPLVCYQTSKKDSKMPNENQNNSNKNIVNQQNGEKLLNIETASSNGFASGFQAIATAYGDYTKQSFEDTKSFVEKMSGVGGSTRRLKCKPNSRRRLTRRLLLSRKRLPHCMAILPSIPTSHLQRCFRPINEFYPAVLEHNCFANRGAFPIC